MAAIEATPVETVETVETVNSMASDSETVMAILPNFKYSVALAQEENVEEIRCQLKALSTHSAEVKATLDSDMDTARQQLQQAEAAVEEVKESERHTAAQLEEKVKTLVEAQMQLQDVEGEKTKVDAEHQEYLLLGDKLREAKSQNISINEGAFCSLLNGSWTSPEDMKEKLEMLKEYLQDIGTEKTLVLAADGLSSAPDARGDFDKMAIDCITEELGLKLKKLEETLAERAPTEREVRAEVFGLQALFDICQEKETAAVEEHKQVEAVVKGSKTQMKTCKQQVTKASKELQKLSAKMEEEETKAKSLLEASEALNRLVEAAVAEKAAAEKAAAEKAAAEKAAAEEAAAEKAAAEKAAAEQAAAEKAAAEAAIAAEKVEAEAAQAAKAAEAEQVAIEDLEPPTKRMRTGQEAEQEEPLNKEAKLEAQVASPARVRVSIG